MSKKKTGMSWYRRFMNYIMTWRLHRETIKELNKLSTKELRDIGLNRNDIDRMVWLDADMKVRGTKGKQ